MKNLLALFLMAGLFLLSSCSDINELEQEIKATSNETTLKIQASLEGLSLEDETRATAEATTLVTWKKGDKISVVNLTTGKALGGDLIANGNGLTTTFSGTLKGTFKENVTNILGFIYPSQNYTEEQDFNGASVSLYEQNGLADTENFVVTSTLAYNPDQTVYSLSFKYTMSFHLVSLTNLPPNETINEISITGLGNTVNLTVNSSRTGFDVGTDVDRLTVKPDEKVSKLDADGSRFFYHRIPASPSNSNRKVKVSTSAGDFEGTYYANAIAASKFTNRIINKFVEKMYIEDPIFEQYLYDNFDTNKDGVLSQEECDAVTDINCSGQEELDENNNCVAEYNNGIRSLSGIEKFKKLKRLDCFLNKLTSLDLSQNTELEYLECKKNELVSINVSANTKLTTLSCWRNNLTTLNVSKNVNLEHFDCGVNNLSSLDVTNLPKLRILYSGANPFANLNVTNNSKLYELNIDNTKLKSIDLGNNPELFALRCENSPLISLDVSSNSKLAYLDCNNCNLISLNVSSNSDLQFLNCSDCNLTSLDVSNNVKLTLLHCYRNNLTSLDVSNLSELTTLNCCENYTIESLNLGTINKIDFLQCAHNKLQSLDLTHLTELYFLGCDFNSLTELNLQKNTNLTEIFCNENKFEELDLSYTSIDSSSAEYPVHCGSSFLRKVTLVTGWNNIKGLNNPRSSSCINEEAEIEYVESPIKTGQEY